NPRLYRILAGRLEHICELLARGGARLSLTTRLDVDAPATDPADIARDREIGRRLHSTRVIDRRAGSCFELVESDEIGVVAIAAGGHGTVVQGQRLRRHEGRIDLSKG